MTKPYYAASYNDTVRAKLWKVIVCVAGGDGTAADREKVTAETRVIAVVMPNAQDAGKAWGEYRVSVKDVEALTGYTFLAGLSPKVVGALETVDDGSVR